MRKKHDYNKRWSPLGVIVSFIGLKLLNKYAPKRYRISKGMCYFSIFGDGIEMYPDRENNDGQLFYDSYKKYKKFQYAESSQHLKFGMKLSKKENYIKRAVSLKRFFLNQ